MEPLKLPPLGDAANKYLVELTEPEINAIHFMHGHLKAFVMMAELDKNPSAPTQVAAMALKHYMPTLDGLKEKLDMFDDREPL